MVDKISKANKSGLVIMTVCIILVVLAGLAWGIGRYVFVDTLSRFSRVLYSAKPGKLDKFLKDCQTRHAHLSRKENGTLLVNLQNKQTVKLIDSPDADGSRVTYAYLLFVPEINTHLIAKRWGEQRRYVLLNNKTGLTQTVWNLPKLSPRKNRLAVASHDLVSGFTVNGIQVFDVASGNYVKQFEQELDWGAANPRWLNNDAFVVDKYIYDTRSCFTENLAGRVTIRRAADRWHIEN
ncbi:hypothetical protein NO1_1612 [Candidatus Termititenax aidoneus]|uniref:Uncharacterized protein n=1 Tax=Termititenax aidoneus TaxID=2218524 RepID=A0A388TD25_TERA1|nr:hypothetical protein NO1_1612 [Candidatus Termititenax aidoneus]